jgi:uncharacterized protein
MQRGCLAWLAGLLFVLASIPGLSQGIDCGKARSPIDLAICASPALMAQDRLLAGTYGQALANDPAHADAIRQAQRQWLSERAGSCASAPQKAAHDCLSRFYASRISALSGTATAAAAVSADVPQPDASLETDRFATAGEHATLLRVKQPGRFAIKAESPTGTALQLVDMLTGPSDLAGEPGTSDGRLDLLLDVGTYKLRQFGAARAEGETRLSVTPFRALRSPETAPAAGEVASGELGDLQQHAFWLAVGPPGHIRIEAAGRSLRDLRLWHDGVDLVAIDAEARTIEPTHGHPLNDFLIEGAVEPGTYLVSLYGGPALAWADSSAVQPFHLRVGNATTLLDGWVKGRIGPLGNEVYEASPQVTSFRLDLADPAPVRVSVRGDAEVLGQAAIAKDSREPNTTVRVAPGDRGTRLVEISGAEGQNFELRGFRLSQARTLSNPGEWWISAETVGFGGDELPATILLVRRDPKLGVVPVASSTPRVDPGQAWRWRFDLRGPSSLLFEVTEPGPVAVRAEGVALQPAIDALGGERSVRRGDGAAPYQWDLATGWYVLRLNPVGAGTGSLDLTVGPPGLIPDRPSPQQPPAPAIPFGRQTISSGEALTLLSGDGPGTTAALAQRALPVDLEASPLTATVDAGHRFEVPVIFPATGSLAATVIGEGAATVELRDPHDGAGKRAGTARISTSERARTVILSWHPPPATTAISVPAKPATPETLEAGRPRFFDLTNGERRSFGLAVGEGGLYRVETLGRLKTEGWIGTSFLAELGHEAANGHGQNMLLQRYLRAGRYRVTVAADDSAGRVGILASPAPLVTGATLLPGGSVRATMPAGSGVAFPIEIAEAGTYHLDLVGLGRKFTARLEDQEGWPILPAGDLSSLDRALSSGRYRLLILPEAVDARVVARLARLRPEVILQGHGPHALLFDAEQRFQWREPPGRDDPRVPDEWKFALAGPAHVTIDISDGMVADLRRRDGPALARLVYKSGFDGELAPGEYRIEAASLGRNDRLDYTLSLRSQELQPDRPRRVGLPATVPFALERDRAVSLTSFGDVDVKAVLRDGDGHLIGRFDDRTDDWNIAVSRYLPAGHYTLDLSSVAPPPATPSETAQNEKADDESEEGEQPSTEPDDRSKEGETAETAEQEVPGHRVELRLALPRESATADGQAVGTVPLAGAEVHRLALPPMVAGNLMLAAAASTAELILSLERRDPDDSWHAVALDQGRAPVVAIPTDGDASRPWRASVWTIDGGPEPVQFAIRNVSAAEQPLGAVALAPLALDGVFGSVRTVLVRAPQADLIRVRQEVAGILAGSAAGHALRPIEGGIIVPQSDRVWLISRGRAEAALTLDPLVPAPSEAVGLRLPPGGIATIPAVPVAEGRLRIWLAESGFGQPGLTAGRGMGVMPGSAFALAGPSAIKVWNAGNGDALRLRLKSLELRILPERQVDGALSATVPAASAIPLRLPEGAKRLGLDLPNAAAAIAGWRGEDAVTAWTGDAPASWLLEGGWTELLLVNPGLHPLPVTVSFVPLAGEPAALRPGVSEKRFFGSAGTFTLPLETRAGQRLIVAGAEAATLIAADGSVRRGSVIPLSGSGRLMLRHRPGLLAAWIEGEGVSPWPTASPQAVTLPAELTLAGATMTLSFSAPTPAVLHARTTAPVIAALSQGGGAVAPELFPAGAEFHRYLAAGAAELRLISPHDGPLAGSLDVSATPVIPAGEGVGDAVTIAPGGSALFAFEVVQDGAVGVGIRADPDRVMVRLLDANGTALGDGVAMLRRLQPGHYLIEARLPPDAETTLVRPAVIGITPRAKGAPAEVARHYLELVGMVPVTAR